MDTVIWAGISTLPMPLSHGRHPDTKEKHEQDFREFYFDNVVWVLVWRGSTETSLHVTPTWAGEARDTELPLQTPLKSDSNTLVSDERAASGSDMITSDSIIPTLRLGTKKRYEERPNSCLLCCSWVIFIHSSGDVNLVNADYRVGG